MRISSPRLRRLDNALAALPAESETMLLSDLDGYVAGVVVCPDPIPPGEWLPQVWGEEGGTNPPFEDERDARWYADLVMEHHDAVARTLGRRAGSYAPFFEVDARHDETLWELWIEGFAMAMALRPDSWARIADSRDEAATKALAGMTTLAAIAQDESDLEREAIDALTEAAPRLIPDWVEALNRWRLAHCAAPSVSVAVPGKIGRNDPCPCGSGRKYKKCCGSN